MNNKTILGNAPEEGGSSKDAVHVAIVSVIAYCGIEPGQQVYITDRRYAAPVAESYQEGIGVADPWRKETIEEGGLLWVLLNPGSITGLRHDWRHDEFEEGYDVHYDDGCRNCS